MSWRATALIKINAFITLCTAIIAIDAWQNLGSSLSTWFVTVLFVLNFANFLFVIKSEEPKKEE